VSIMRLVREMDAGPILAQRSEPIGPETTAGELYGRLAELGGELLVDVLEALAAGEIDERPQDDGLATFAPKLGRAEGRLDWSATAEEVANRIRGCDPWPAAWSELDGTPVQLFEPRVEEPAASEPASEPGTVMSPASRGLVVAAGTGVVRIGAVKPAGRARMPATAWIAGRAVAAGDRFR